MKNVAVDGLYHLHIRWMDDILGVARLVGHVFSCCRCFLSARLPPGLLRSWAGLPALCGELVMPAFSWDHALCTGARPYSASVMYV